MKKSFTIVVDAPSPEAAFQKAVASGIRKSEFKVLADPPNAVRGEVERKLKRVIENPGLYADKIQEYKDILSRFQKATDREAATVQMMIEHGDGRIDNPQTLGIRQQKSGRWWVFGYDFA